MSCSAVASACEIRMFHWCAANGKAIISRDMGSGIEGLRAEDCKKNSAQNVHTGKLRIYPLVCKERNVCLFW